MIEMRWLVSNVDGVRTLQYRNAPELVSQDRSTGSSTWTAGTDWKDVPVVHEMAAARPANEDTTGLCTVREWAAAILENPIYGEHSAQGFAPAAKDNPNAVPWCEMSFAHNGRRYNVEMVVTKVEDVK